VWAMRAIGGVYVAPTGTSPRARRHGHVARIAHTGHVARIARTGHDAHTGHNALHQ